MVPFSFLRLSYDEKNNPSAHQFAQLFWRQRDSNVCLISRWGDGVGKGAFRLETYLSPSRPLFERDTLIAQGYRITHRGTVLLSDTLALAPTATGLQEAVAAAVVAGTVLATGGENWRPVSEDASATEEHMLEREAALKDELIRAARRLDGHLTKRIPRRD